jgi:hypothetical protein
MDVIMLSEIRPSAIVVYRNAQICGTYETALNYYEEPLDLSSATKCD